MISRGLWRLAVTVWVCVGCGLAQTAIPAAPATPATPAIPAAPAIPATPAGRTLQAWLDAFNSGDRTKIAEYVKTVDTSESVDGMMSFHDQTGGFEPLSIESSEPLHIRFRVKEKDGPTTALGNLLVKDGQPPTVVTFGLRAVPPGVKLENVTLDAALRKRVIDGVDQELTEYYIEPTVAQQMAAALHSHEARGEYDGITDGDAFAERLTKDLQAVSHDRHLRVNFNPFKTPEEKEPTPDQVARNQQQTLRQNCGFDKVEILPGNIGYVKFDEFAAASLCGPTVAAAMGFVAHTDALIFDLRQNSGGYPAMVSFIASYLFDKPTHLNDMYIRHENSTRQYWTLPYVPGERMATQPVYVLTSKGTFSGAEEFCYDLKNQKRATIVGETTGGGAHPVDGHVVADYFMVAVPVGRPTNPVSKTDWEGTGVEPDVKVPAADALATAEKLATEKIQAAAKISPK